MKHGYTLSTTTPWHRDHPVSSEPANPSMRCERSPDIACFPRANMYKNPLGLLLCIVPHLSDRPSPSKRRTWAGRAKRGDREREDPVSDDPLLALFTSHSTRGGALETVVCSKTTRPKPPCLLFHCIPDYPLPSMQLFPSASPNYC